jgi:hypothetical protein
LDLLTRLNIANSVVDLAQYTVAVILVGRIWQAQLAQLENPDVAPTGFADAGPQTG